MSKLYSTSAASEFISKCVDLGGVIVQLSDGVLGHGDLIIIMPDKYYNYRITEIAVNEWSSGHKIASRAIIPATWQKLIDNV